MSYATPWYAAFAIAAWFIWTLAFWRIFRRSPIILPQRFRLKKVIWWRLLTYAVGCAAWGYMAFALTQPRIPLASIEGKSEVNDIFFVVDASGSMTALDFKPNRMEASKKRLLEFVDLKPKDRMGIIVFGTKAFTLMPLTTDLNLVKQMIASLEAPFQGLGPGTNIGDALALAAGRAAQSLAKNKVIILLTDGEANAGTLNPLEAAEKVKAQAIKIYSIGMGSKEEALMPVQDQFGRTFYQKIPGGSFDMETLQKISELTGGRSYAANSETALRNILRDIDKLERTEIETFGRVVYEELYWKYLAISVLLLMMELLLRRLFIREGV